MERPLCTHCGLLGHTINKCYKIHVYPPGYKQKSRNFTANQVTAQPVADSVSTQFPFSQEQCNQLFALLQNTSNMSSVNQACTSSALSSYSLPSTSDPNFSGLHVTLSSTVGHHTSPIEFWILDSGATDRMTGSISCFSSIRTCVNISVKLSNGSHTKVTHRHN